MSRKLALGVLDTVGFVPLVEAMDVMLKTAPVTVREVHEVG